MIEQGDEAPDFTLEDQHGKRVSLSDLRGERVVLYFYPRASTSGCTTQACGIRDRSADYEKAGAKVIGISPDEVADIASSLAMETGITHSRGEVLAAIIRRFAIRAQQIDADFSALMDQVRQRCVLSGKTVQLVTPAGPRVGVVDGLSHAGELIFRRASGTEHLIQADEIRIVSSSEQNPILLPLTESSLS